MMTKKQVSANLRAFYLGRLDWIALTIVAVVELWTSNGLNLAKILLLQGIFGFAIMLLEYPSGVIADMTSRRKILIFAAIMHIMGTIFYLYARTFLAFLGAEIFYAFAMASQSGADAALIYDTYLEQGDKNGADHVLATSKSLRFANITIMNIFGGILAAIDIRLPFIIASIGYLVTAYSYAKSYEPDRIMAENSSNVMRQSVKVLKNPRIIKLGLMLMFVMVFLRISFWDYLPRLDSLNVNKYWYGIVLAGANLIAFSTSLMMRKFKKLQDHSIGYVVVGIAGLVLFLNQDNLLIVLIAISMHQIYRGSIQVIFEIKLNEQVESQIRASTMSLVSSVNQGVYFVIVAILNVIQFSDYQINEINAILGLIVGISVITINFQLKRRKRWKQNLETNVEPNIFSQEEEIVSWSIQ